MKHGSSTLRKVTIALIVLLVISLFLYQNPDFKVDLDKIVGTGEISGAGITGYGVFNFMGSNIYGSQACFPPTKGDWIIREKVVCKNRAISIDGYLVFQGGEIVFFNSEYNNLKTGEYKKGYFILKE